MFSWLIPYKRSPILIRTGGSPNCPMIGVHKRVDNPGTARMQLEQRMLQISCYIQAVQQVARRYEGGDSGWRNSEAAGAVWPLSFYVFFSTVWYGYVGISMSQTTHFWWFIPPIKMVIRGMVYYCILLLYQQYQVITSLHSWSLPDWRAMFMFNVEPAIIQWIQMGPFRLVRPVLHAQTIHSGLNNSKPWGCSMGIDFTIGLHHLWRSFKSSDGST